MTEPVPRSRKHLPIPAMPATPQRARTVTVADLAGVIYTSGKVFDGLSTGRLDTANFLRSGDTAGITSRQDLSLLLDLRDVAEHILQATETDTAIDAAFVRSVNATITRSGALNPGAFRRADQEIGVNTRYGRHEPAPSDEDSLERLIRQATSGKTPEEGALDLFVEIAKAQPFEDGNKRTALFASNALLIHEHSDKLLIVPVDEANPNVAGEFNNLLARAYVHDDHDGVKSLLRSRGLVSLESQRDVRNRAVHRAVHPSKAERMSQLTREINANAAALTTDDTRDWQSPQL